MKSRPDVKTSSVAELRNVSFKYSRDSEPALKDIDLKISSGEFIGIVGGNGAGKTTLLHILSGVIPHFQAGTLEGEVVIQGQDTEGLSVAEIATNVGLVLQDPESQLFNMYVKQELLWGLENRGIPRREMEQRLDEVLPFFGLEELLDRFCAGISGGQKQKVAIAAIQLLQPQVMLLDSPTSMLDPVSANAVLDIIRELSEQRQTIVVVEENMFELLSRVDRLILMQGGRILVDAPPYEYREHIPALREAGVHVPSVWELSHLLDKRSRPLDVLPLSLEEAVNVVSCWLNKESSNV